MVRYQRQRPGELLHVDIKAKGRIPEGGGHRLLGRADGRRHRRVKTGYDYLHVVVDDCTRLAYVEARTLFLECNPVDLQRGLDQVQRETSVPVEPLLLEQAAAGTGGLEDANVLLTPTSTWPRPARSPPRRPGGAAELRGLGGRRGRAEPSPDAR
jgi:hypothetical protein